jgi:thioredoxin reductase
MKDRPRIAVLGAGPVGLEAALYARGLGFPVKLYERGRPGEYLRRWGHVRMFTPFGMNSTPLGRAAIRADAPHHPFPGLHDLHTGREYLAIYLEPLSRCAALRDSLHPATEVVHVSRRQVHVGDTAEQPFLLLLRGPDGADRLDLADVVLDCTGTFGQHRWLGGDGAPVPGETAAAPHISYWLEDIAGEARGRHADRTVLVVGAGYSAATSVCALADLARTHTKTRTVWLARDPDPLPIRRIVNDPLPERDRLAESANALAAGGTGNVEFHASSAVEAVAFQGADRGFSVTARVAGQSWTWEVDRVVANIGFTPQALLDSELQMNLVPYPPPSGRAVVRSPEPNCYILGSKSYGRNADFLLTEGFDEVRAAFALITGQPGLDLYQET